MCDGVWARADSGDDALPCRLARRSTSVGGFLPRDLPELMDGDCRYEDFRDCLRSLGEVNRWLLGYRPTLAWLERLPLGPLDSGTHRRCGQWRRRSAATDCRLGTESGDCCQVDRDRPESLCGACGSGVHAEGSRNRVGDKRCSGVRPEKPIDIVVSSLMVHRLEDVEFIALLRWMEANAQVGWFISDLERSEWGCRMFGWLANVAGWHQFVQHDGPVSFRRAFQKEDWVRLLAAAEVPQETVTVEHWRTKTVYAWGGGSEAGYPEASR